MPRYAVYDTDGLITQVIDCPEDHIDLQDLGSDSYIEVDSFVSFQTHYISNNLPVDKQPMDLSATLMTIPADGITETVITGIPVGTVASANGYSVDVDDGSLEFSTEKAGVNTITFTNEPVYKTTIFKVTASG